MNRYNNEMSPIKLTHQREVIWGIHMVNTWVWNRLTTSEERVWRTIMRPHGLQVQNPNPNWGGNSHANYGAYHRECGKGGAVPTLDIPKGGFQVGRSSGKWRKTHGKWTRSARSFSTPSNASSTGASHNTNATIETCPNHRIVTGGLLVAHREDKKDRLEYAKRLLGRPNDNIPNPVALVTDTLENKNCVNKLGPYGGGWVVLWMKGQ